MCQEARYDGGEVRVRGSSDRFAGTELSCGGGGLAEPGEPRGGLGGGAGGIACRRPG